MFSLYFRYGKEKGDEKEKMDPKDRERIEKLSGRQARICLIYLVEHPWLFSEALEVAESYPE